VLGGLFYGHHKPGMFTLEHEHLLSAVATQAAFALDNANLFEKTFSLNAKKDEFIGMASHELKTPLTSLLGYLQIIDMQLQDDHPTKVFIQKAFQQGNKLNRLVTDLLEVSKMEAGKLPLALTNFDMVSLLKDTIESMQYSTKTHNIKFHTSLSKLNINADKQRIEQVIMNLISNAIKYSYNADLVNIFLSATENEVIAEFQDFGIGIKTEQIEQIFMRFYRVEDISESISGLGLGLYISKEIINRHKGNLWVKSQHGKGSSFYFSLPLQIAITE